MMPNPPSFQERAEVDRHHVDAHAGQAEVARHLLRQDQVVDVDRRGDVDADPAGRQVRDLAQPDLAPAARDALARVALLLDAGDHRLVADDLGHRRGRAVGAGRRRVLALDQLVDGRAAVALDPGRPALERRDEAAVDAEQAVVAAGEAGLDDDRGPITPPPARAKAARSSSASRTLAVTPIPLWPSSGLTATGQPISSRRRLRLRELGHHVARAAPGSPAGRGTPCSRPCGW